MKIITTGLGTADCEGMGRRKTVDTLMVGEQSPGTWVLVFLNSAREILTEAEASKITLALSALSSVHDNNDEPGEEPINQFFSDLVNRPIQKPETTIRLEEVPRRSDEHDES